MRHCVRRTPLVYMSVEISVGMCNRNDSYSRVFHSEINISEFKQKICLNKRGRNCEFVTFIWSFRKGCDFLTRKFLDSSLLALTFSLRSLEFRLKERKKRFEL